ncbi:MAG: trypsin [Gemmatimonadetes bacterium]|nr:trypsin [Gemmatimonadota bacterium]
MLEAQYVDTDNFLDLAVLRVEASDLPVAPLGRSSDIFVGEWTIAIGNPFDLGPTVTAGVVSAVDRDFQESKGDYHYRNMIQTDAAINPGNSGGPLVNALGEVIGINSFIYTGSNYSTGSIGIGFAIPVDAARRFLEEVRTHGRVRKPWTGIVDMTNFTPRLGRYLDLPISEGAIVTHVAVDSPAADSGLKRGDAIVAINGEKVRSEEEAWGILRSLRVGDTGSLAVVNTDGRHIVTFRLQELQQQRQGWY